MYTRILVPLDGSGCAAHALRVAARLARASRGSVILVRVVSTATEFWPYLSLSPQTALAQTMIDADLAEAEEYLSALTRAPDLDGLPTGTVVLRGPTVPTLLSVARSYQADVIVLCSHSSTGRKRWGTGGVAEQVVRHAPVPVLILREGGPLPAESHLDAAHPLRALVAVDGSVRAEAAIEPAASLPDSLSWTPGVPGLWLLQVWSEQGVATQRTDAYGTVRGQEHGAIGWGCQSAGVTEETWRKGVFLPLPRLCSSSHVHPLQAEQKTAWSGCRTDI